MRSRTLTSGLIASVLASSLLLVLAYTGGTGLALADTPSPGATQQAERFVVTSPANWLTDAGSAQKAGTAGTAPFVPDSSPPPPPITSAPPTDPDGDGLYEDVNGDGTLTVRDREALKQNLNSAAVQNNIQYFDFNQDGTVDFLDVVALDREITGSGGGGGNTTNSPPTADFNYQPTNPTPGEQIRLNGNRSSDPDGRIQQFEWDTTGDGRVDTTGAFPTITYSAPGSYQVTLTVTDDDGATDRTSATIQVASTNSPPTAAAGGTRQVRAGETVTLDGTGSFDPDGDSLSYAWQQLRGPSVNLRNARSPKPEFTAPDVSARSTLAFELSVQDSAGARDTDTVEVIVQPRTTNNPPNADAGGDRSVESGADVTLDASGSIDPDGDPLGYTWRQISGPDVDIASPNDPRTAFRAPDVPTRTTLGFEVTVSDTSGARDTDTVDVIVDPQETNSPPTAAAGEDRTVDAGQDVTLDGTASSDPDGDALSFSWSQIGGPDVTVADTDTATPSFTAPEVERNTTLEFRLRVDDGAGGTDGDTVEIGIRPTRSNPPPTAVTDSNRTVVAGSTVALDATDSSDPDGETLSYTWTQRSGPDVTVTDADTPRPSFTAPDVGTATDLVFAVRVSDAAGATATDVVRLIVRPQTSDVNLSTTDRSVTAGETVTLTFDVRNPGEPVARPTTLTLTGIPENWTVQTASDAGGNWNREARRWTWESFPSGSKVRPTVTLSVPLVAEGTYTIQGTIQHGASGVGASAIATVTVSRPAGMSIEARSQSGTFPSGSTRVFVRVAHDGTDPLSEPVVHLDLPPGWEITRNTAGAGSLRPTAAEWHLPTVQPGDSLGREIELVVPENATTDTHTIPVTVTSADLADVATNATVTVRFKRGFFSNNANSQFSMLADVGNLTLLGFILSIAGIMLELRRGI